MGGSSEDWRHVQSRQSGLSLPISSSSTTPTDCAAKLANAVSEQVSGSFALCGYSLGGRIALLAAHELIAKKKKPDSVILVSSGLGISTEKERAERNRKDEEWAVLAASNSEDFWGKWYAQELFASFHSAPEARRASWMEQRKTLDIDALTGQLRNLGPGRHESLLRPLKELPGKGVRVLYLAGELDKKYGELAHKVREIPGVSVEIIPGAGHVLPLEAPEALALRIARFLK